MARPASATELHAERPLSPHLQVFRPLMTMMMSIVHRITGVALYGGSALLAAWLLAAAAGPGPFSKAQAIAQSWPGFVVAFGYSWALIHHMLGGLRHFVWDLGYGYGAPVRDWLAWGTLIGSVGLTALLWAIALVAA